MAYSNKIQEMLSHVAMIRRQAVTVNMELLPVCNLQCKMCYIRTDMAEVNRQGGLIPAECWIDLAKELRKEGVVFLLLTGGEVFLYPQFRELYITLYKMGFVLTINTNATLIDEDTVLWLKEYPPKCVSISLYGASDETYERICGKKGMFTRVDRATRMLLEHGVRVEYKTIFTPLNVCDIEGCWEYVKSLGVYYETDSYAFPPARNMKLEQPIRFMPDEAIECRFRYKRISENDRQFKGRIIKHLLKYERTKDIPGSDLYGFTCGATRSSCWITWQGHMTPCAMLEEPYTLPFKDGYLQAWEALKEECDQILMSSECSHCDKREVCSACPATNMAESGSFSLKSEYHCRFTEKTLQDMYRMVDEWGIDVHQIAEGREEEQ